MGAVRHGPPKNTIFQHGSWMGAARHGLPKNAAFQRANPSNSGETKPLSPQSRGE